MNSIYVNLILLKDGKIQNLIQSIGTAFKIFKNEICCVWWLTLAVLALGRLRKEGCHDFQASLGYIVWKEFQVNEFGATCETLSEKQNKRNRTNKQKERKKLIAEPGSQRYTVFIFLMSLISCQICSVFGVEVMIIFKIHSVETLSDSPCTSLPLSL